MACTLGIFLTMGGANASTIGTLRRDTKRIGDLSEAVVLPKMVAAGYHVAIPFGENHRYDLIIEKDHRLWRVQVKTGRYRRGIIRFNCYSSHAHRNGTSCRPYLGEIDLFAVYCPDNGCVYVVPVADVAMKGALRVDATRNNQAAGIRWAEHYLLK